MAHSGTLGALLQGVSQQPAYIRSDGQVTEQINWLPDVTKGLSTRPGVVQVSTITPAHTDHRWLEFALNGTKYQLGYRDGDMIVIDEAGTSSTVVEGYANAYDYVGTSQLASYVYDNKLYISNRDKIVQASADTSAAEAEVLTDVFLATCLGGNFSKTYTATFTYSDGTQLNSSYTCPNGAAAGDAALTASDFIMQQLASQLGADPQLKVGTGVARAGSTLVIWSTTGVTADGLLETTDAEGDTVMRAQGNTARTIEDLSKYAPEGTLVRITGENSNEDDFWLRYDIASETVPGAGFGKSGTWREHFNTAEPSGFDLTTVPHTITESGGVFTLDTGNWQGRRVGDEETNPMPSFVGNTIRDINGFQSRLVFISGQATVMSRTNIALDFFKKSATSNLPEDPIDVISTSETEYDLDWIIPFDRDLVIWAGGSQFLITGATALTPANASIVATTNFEMQPNTRPVSTGRTVLFPFRSGRYVGVKEFYSANSVDANEAISITKVQDEYMLGNIVDMVSSTNFSTVICRTDGAGQENLLFVYQYFFNGEEKLQSAWFKLEFQNPVRNMLFDGSRLSLLMLDEDAGEYVTGYADLDIPKDADVNINVSLDRRTYETAVDVDFLTTSVTREIEDCSTVQGLNCAVPGQEATVQAVIDNGDGTFTYHLNKTTVPVGAKVYVGQPFEKVLQPTMPFYRDRNGSVVSNANITVTDFEIYFEDSGQIDVRMDSKYRANPVLQNNGYLPIAGLLDDPEADGLQSGSYKFPWGERSDWSELTISSTDVKPVTITEIEWFGQIQKRGERR
tara:strand:+ start:5575 stop:7965 length:2391 start_codon:yes stop_codon:yes gene_type:complete